MPPVLPPQGQEGRQALLSEMAPRLSRHLSAAEQPALRAGIWAQQGAAAAAQLILQPAPVTCRRGEGGVGGAHGEILWLGGGG